MCLAREIPNISVTRQILSSGRWPVASGGLSTGRIVYQTSSVRIDIAYKFASTDVGNAYNRPQAEVFRVDPSFRMIYSYSCVYTSTAELDDALDCFTILAVPRS